MLKLFFTFDLYDYQIVYCVFSFRRESSSNQRFQVNLSTININDAPLPRNSSKKPVTVLYIEDDSANRQLVRFILAIRSDIQLIEAETGMTGLEYVSEHQPDIVLLDLNLPDLSGYEILTRIRHDYNMTPTPVIAVSGDSHPEDISRGLKAGFQAYLTKPIVIAKLFTALDTAIESLPE
jgi:CheY-like chemotaxis protein